MTSTSSSRKRDYDNLGHDSHPTVNARLLPLIMMLLVALSASDETMAQGRILINEVMQSNVDYLMVNHDFPDSWVELYNSSDKEISVQKYRIGPTNMYADAFELSEKAVSIDPGEHLILYCDKTTETPFHYNFNLESDKGKLFLFDHEGNIVDSLVYKSMPAPNIAYGRITDGSSSWQYEMTATPGAANNSSGSDIVSPQPWFSTDGHVMTGGPETITISMPWGVPEDTRIHFTTDGSEPDWESASDTLITLTIDESTVVRAKLLSKEMLPIRSTTHSYIFHPRETTLPIVSIATNGSYLYSKKDGILSNDSTEGKPNYSYDWRRPANFEYFRTTDGITVFNQPGEMAVAGASTRSLPQKSIKCYTKKRFGKKYFKGNFWKDKPEVTSVKSFTLRNGGNSFKSPRFNDAAIQRFFGTNLEDIDWQAYEPAIVYINGEYKGICGFRERSNEDYVSSNYGIEEENIEIATTANYKSGKVKDTPHFNAFYALYNRADVTYEELCEVMDVDNFMNVFIAECYSSNYDFPQNNISIWKDVTNNTKWKWILKDLDFVVKKDASFNMFKYMFGTENSQDPEHSLSTRSATVKARRLYERMMSFPEFHDRFIATYATYLGDFLHPELCLPIVLKMNDEILDELAPTFAAYNNMSSVMKHLSYFELFCDYISQRPDFVYRQMADYFHLGEPIPVTVCSDASTDFENNGGLITLCGTPLRTGRFCGAWFTHFPLSIETNESDMAWAMVVKHADGNESTYLHDSALMQPDLTACFPGDSITFIATRSITEDAITASHPNNSRSIAAIYDATGKKVHAMQNGLNIIIYADGSRRKIIK